MPENDPAPEATSLNLLAKDGILRVTFAATLTSEQYAELLRIATRGDSSVSALTVELFGMNQSWGIKVSIKQLR